jgi:hypothetical protein
VPGSGARQREEVINTILAQRIAELGTPSSPETIREKGRARPDVIFSFRGLRCAIEGKVDDVQGARELVLRDAEKRVVQGIANLSVAIVYPAELRTTSFADLPRALDQAVLDFCAYTEVGAGEWHSGRIDQILAELRRAHDLIVRDDVVVAAVGDLNIGLGEVSNALQANRAVCDRLIDVLGIGEASRAEDPD